jgi:hypothetical protein
MPLTIELTLVSYGFFFADLYENTHMGSKYCWLEWLESYSMEHTVLFSRCTTYTYCYNLESCFFSRTFYAPPWSSLHFEYYIEKTPLNHKEKKILTDSTRHFKTKSHKSFSFNIHLHKIFSIGSFWKRFSENITCSPHPTLIHLNMQDNWKLNL